MATVKFDGEAGSIELSRITAKKNYASSMQSHKMGATYMFDAIHKRLREKYPSLANEVNGNVAVKQLPALVFRGELIEGTQDDYSRSYIGNYTVGADKGDNAYFGFTDPRVKDSALRLEGTDHIKGVGFNYPWGVNGNKNIRYNADKKALCIVTGDDPTKWSAILEQSYCAGKNTAEEIEAYLEAEFRPAFDCAYRANPLLVGVTMSVEEMNADVEAFGKLRRTDGRPYSYCEVWRDGEYDLYGLNLERNRYEKNGVNLYADLTAEEKARVDAATSLDEKNAIFIQHRIDRFANEVGNYFCVDDALYQMAFLFIIAASDNFEKNMYPYKMAKFADGGRCRFLQDDLDSIFSTDNQAQDTKSYSVELHDFTDDTQSAYVFKGEDNAFFQALEMAFPDRFNRMGRDILQAMYDTSPTGTTTMEKLMGFFDEFFFSRAQRYFPKSAYNNDAEIAYEEAWNNADYVKSVDIHPLAQSLGDHYLAERGWLEKRMIYVMSKFGFGGYADYNDSEQGVISLRTQDAQGFTVTPAIDSYPTLLGGQSQTSRSAVRVRAGESVTLAPVGGGNTNTYIVGADWLIDIGDLKALRFDPSAVVTFSVSSKRLQRLKIGDEVAESVTSPLPALSVGNCPSLITVDARNLATLRGTIDLTGCPRLREALFGGTNVTGVRIGAGCKVERIQLPDSITVLDLRNASFLTELEVGSLGNVGFLRLENNPHIDGFATLKEAFTAGEALQNIRIVGFDHNGDATDIVMLSTLADGNYYGIRADGEPDSTILPVIEGVLHITDPVNGEDYDKVVAAFPSLTLDAPNIVNYIKFADPVVQEICATNWGDGAGTGITREQAAAVTSLGSAFMGNKEISEFEEFEKFTKVASIGVMGTATSVGNSFKDCTNLKSLRVPNSLTGIGYYGLSGCTNLETIGNMSNITEIRIGAFDKCYAFSDDVIAPNLIKMADGFSFTSVKRVLDLGSITSLPQAFTGCKKLEVIILPSTLASIAHYAFNDTSESEYILISLATTPPTLGSVSKSGFSRILVPDDSVEAYKAASNWSTYASRIFPISQLPSDNLELYKEIKDYIGGAIQKFFILPQTTEICTPELHLAAYYDGVEVSPTYTIEQTDIATISNDGLLTFSQEGSVVVSAEYNGETASETYTYAVVQIKNGVTLNSNGTTSASTTMSTVGFVETNGATSVQWGVTGGTLGTLCEYKEDGTCNDYWGGNQNPRTVTMNSTSTKVKASFSTAHLDYAYIKNATTGEYLWKGKLVE